MIEADTSDGVETSQIVLVWVVVPMPCDNIKRGVRLLCLEQLPVELGELLPLATHIMHIAGHRRLKVSRIRQTVCSYRSQFW